MEENPFTVLMNAIRNDSMANFPVTFRFGTVIASQPLKLNVAGTVQEASSLLKNSAINEFGEGDKLLLVPIEEEQRYIILCRVVGV